MFDRLMRSSLEKISRALGKARRQLTLWDIRNRRIMSARPPGKLRLDLAIRRSGATDSEITQSRPSTVLGGVAAVYITCSLRRQQDRISGTLACIDRHSSARPTATLLSSFRGYLRKSGPGYRRLWANTERRSVSAHRAPVRPHDFWNLLRSGTGGRVKNINPDCGCRAKGFARAAVRGGADSRGARHAQALLDRLGY